MAVNFAKYNYRRMRIKNQIFLGYVIVISATAEPDKVVVIAFLICDSLYYFFKKRQVFYVFDLLSKTLPLQQLEASAYWCSLRSEQKAFDPSIAIPVVNFLLRFQCS